MKAIYYVDLMGNIYIISEDSNRRDMIDSCREQRTQTLSNRIVEQFQSNKCLIYLDSLSEDEEE